MRREERRVQKHAAATKIQAWYRAISAQRWRTFFEALDAACLIQRVFRKFIHAKKLKSLVSIQRWWRERLETKTQERAAAVVQKWYLSVKGNRSRGLALRREVCGETILRYWRQFQLRRKWRKETIITSAISSISAAYVDSLLSEAVGNHLSRNQYYFSDDGYGTTCFVTQTEGERHTDTPTTYYSRSIQTFSERAIEHGSESHVAGDVVVANVECRTSNREDNTTITAGHTGGLQRAILTDKELKINSRYLPCGTAPIPNERDQLERRRILQEQIQHRLNKACARLRQEAVLKELKEQRLLKLKTRDHERKMRQKRIHDMQLSLIESHEKYRVEMKLQVEVEAEREKREKEERMAAAWKEGERRRLESYRKAQRKLEADRKATLEAARQEQVLKREIAAAKMKERLLALSRLNDERMEEERKKNIVSQEKLRLKKEECEQKYREARKIMLQRIALHRRGLGSKAMKGEGKETEPLLGDRTGPNCSNQEPGDDPHRETLGDADQGTNYASSASSVVRLPTIDFVNLSAINTSLHGSDGQINTSTKPASSAGGSREDDSMNQGGKKMKRSEPASVCDKGSLNRRNPSRVHPSKPRNDEFRLSLLATYGVDPHEAQCHPVDRVTAHPVRPSSSKNGIPAGVLKFISKIRLLTLPENAPSSACTA